MGTAGGLALPELHGISGENKVRYAKRRRRDGSLKVSSIDSILIASTNGSTPTSSMSKTRPQNSLCSNGNNNLIVGDVSFGEETDFPPSESEPVLPSRPKNSISQNSNDGLKMSNAPYEPKMRSMSISSAQSTPTYRSKRVKNRSNSIRSLPLAFCEQNIDHVLALHQKSCSIFNEPRQGAGSPYLPSRSLSSSSTDKTSRSSSPQSLEGERRSGHDSSSSSLCESCTGQEDVPPTIIHWNSDATRLREYAEIEKYAKGFHGFFRRFGPKWCYRNARQPFFDSTRSSDAGSVRRYRVDVSDAEEERQPSKNKRRKLGGKRGWRWIGTTMKSPFRVLVH